MVAEMEASEADTDDQDDIAVEEKPKKSKLGKLIPKVLKKSSKKKKKKKKDKQKQDGGDDDSSVEEKGTFFKKKKSSKRKTKEKSGDEHSVETKSHEPQSPKTSNESLMVSPPRSPKQDPGAATASHPLAKLISNNQEPLDSSPKSSSSQKPSMESISEKLKKEESIEASQRIKPESENQSSSKKLDTKLGSSRKLEKSEKRSSSSSKILEPQDTPDGKPESNKSSSSKKLEGKKSSSSKKLAEKRTSSRKLDNKEDKPPSSRKLDKEDKPPSSRKLEKRRSSKKMKKEDSMRTSKQKEARKQSSSKRKKRKDNLDKEFLRAMFRRIVRKLIWTNIFFQQTALKALEMQNRADEIRYQKSRVNSQLKDTFLDDDDDDDEDKDQPIAPLAPLAPPSPFVKPKQSSFKKGSVDGILKDFVVNPKPDKPKKTVHFPEGPGILDVRVFPKQYDPFTKSIVFYTDEEIKKFRFEKYLEDHEDEFEEVVDTEDEYEWVEEEIIEIEEGFEFEEVEYVYEEDAVSI